MASRPVKKQGQATPVAQPPALVPPLSPEVLAAAQDDTGWSSTPAPASDPAAVLQSPEVLAAAASDSDWTDGALLNPGDPDVIERRRRTLRIQGRMDIPENALDPYATDESLGGALLRQTDVFAGAGKAAADLGYGLLRHGVRGVETSPVGLAVRGAIGAGGRAVAAAQGVESDHDWLPSLSSGMPGRIDAFQPEEARPGEPLSAEKLGYHATNILSWLLPATKMAKVGEGAELAARLGTAARLERAPDLAARLPRALPRLAGFLTRVGTEAVSGAGMGMIQSGGEDTMKRDASIGAGAYTLQALTRALFSLKFSPQLVGQLIKPTKEQLAFGANPVEGLLKEKVVGMTLEDLVRNIDDRIGQLDAEATSLITEVPQYRNIVLPQARQLMEASFTSAAALARRHGKGAAAVQILRRAQAYLAEFDRAVAQNGGRVSLKALLDVRRFMQQGVNWAKPGLSKAIEGKTPVVTQAGVAVDEAIVDAYKSLNTLIYEATGSVRGKSVGRLQSLFQREHNLLAAKDSVDGTLVDAAQKAWSRSYALRGGAAGFGIGAAVSTERQLTANERISPVRVITDALVGTIAGIGAGKAVAGTRALFSSTPAITARANFYRGLWPKVEPPPIDLPAPVSVDLPESQLPKAIPVRMRGDVEEIIAVPPGLTAMEEAEFLEKAGVLKSPPRGSVRPTKVGVPETMPAIGRRPPVPSWAGGKPPASTPPSTATPPSSESAVPPKAVRKHAHGTKSSATKTPAGKPVESTVKSPMVTSTPKPATPKPDVAVPTSEAFTSAFKAGDRVVIRVAGRNRPLRGKVIGPAASKTPALTVATDSGQYAVPLSAIEADTKAPTAFLGVRPPNRRLPGGEE